MTALSIWASMNGEVILGCVVIEVSGVEGESDWFPGNQTKPGRVIHTFRSDERRSILGPDLGIAPSLAGSSRYTLEAVDYRSGAIDLTLRAPDVATLDGLRETFVALGLAVPAASASARLLAFSADSSGASFIESL